MGRRDTFLLSILTVVTAFAWILFDVYHAYVDTTIPETIEEQLVPITPKFDRAYIEKMNQRQKVDPLDKTTLGVKPATSTPEISTQSGNH